MRDSLHMSFFLTRARAVRQLYFWNLHFFLEIIMPLDAYSFGSTPGHEMWTTDFTVVYKLTARGEWVKDFIQPCRSR
jgi:hypothetical protein